jgi:hypothetical protein
MVSNVKIEVRNPVLSTVTGRFAKMYCKLQMRKKHQRSQNWLQTKLKINHQQPQYVEVDLNKKSFSGPKTTTG